MLNAVYVHCVAHNLNLVVKDAVKIVTVHQIYNFFGQSIKRWNTLSNFISSKEGGGAPTSVIKSN